MPGLDWSSFFTPRFPRRSVNVFTDDELADLDTRTRLGPELPPDWSADVNIDRLGIDPLRQEELAGINKYAIEKPIRPKHPSVAESLAVPLEKATTSLYPEAENAIIDKAKLTNPLLGELAEFQVGGSTSPLGLLSDYVPIAGPALVKGGAALASKLGAGSLAGIPFLKLGKKVGLRNINAKPVVFRGDPGITYRGERYTHVNPQYYNRADTLGWMTHAAEESSYPESYMFKQGDPTSPHSWSPHSKEARPTISPLTSTATNAVDLTSLPEDPEDVEKLIKGLELWNPARSPFGSTERLTLARAQDLKEEIPSMYRRQMAIDAKLKEGKPLSLRESNDQDEIAEMMRDVRSTLNDPDISNKLGFDAIRYDDQGRMSWAFPDVKKLESPWGSKFTLSSMQDYPYRVVGRKEAATTGESLGHFASKKDAAKAAVSAGTGSKIYLGNDQIARVPYKMNYGLEDYLKADKAIQADIGLGNEGERILNKLSPTADGISNDMYGKPYSKLSDWQKEDVDNAIKNKEPLFSIAESNKLAKEQYGKPYHQLDPHEQTALKQNWLDDNDYDIDAGPDFNIDDPSYYKSSEGEDISNTIKSNKPSVSEDLKDKIKFKIAKEDYGDDYYNLSKDSKLNVDVIYETLVNNPVDDIDWLKKQYPSIADELDAVYGSALGKKK